MGKGQPFVVIHAHKFIGVEVHEREVMGEMQKCISIPCDLNGISLVNGGKQIYISFWLSKCFPNPKGHSHYLTLRFHKSMVSWYLKIKNMGLWQQVKLMGNIFGSDGRYEYGSRRTNASNIQVNNLDKAFENDD